MQLVRLDFLQGEVAKRADIQNETTFVPTADITEYINRGIARVHGLLATSGEPYYRTNFVWPTVTSQQYYYTTAATGVPVGTAVLPQDIFIPWGLDTQVQNQRWLACERMNFERRNDYQAADYFWPIVTYLYDFSNSGAISQIFIEPPPAGAANLKLWYYPVAPQLANASDTWDSANRWDSYVIDWAARLAAEKDENEWMCTRLDASIQEMEAMIKREAASRNLGAAPKIRRVRYRRGVWPWGAPGNVP